MLFKFKSIIKIDNFIILKLSLTTITHYGITEGFLGVYKKPREALQIQTQTMLRLQNDQKA
jgi:hypothetical protein